MTISSASGLLREWDGLVVGPMGKRLRFPSADAAGMGHEYELPSPFPWQPDFMDLKVLLSILDAEHDMMVFCKGGIFIQPSFPGQAYDEVSRQP